MVKRGSEEFSGRVPTKDYVHCRSWSRRRWGVDYCKCFGVLKSSLFPCCCWGGGGGGGGGGGNHVLRLNFKGWYVVIPEGCRVVVGISTRHQSFATISYFSSHCFKAVSLVGIYPLQGLNNYSNIVTHDGAILEYYLK